VERLPSYHRSAALRVHPGAAVQKTVDRFSCPGWVTLMHRDREVIEEGIRRILELEEEGLFTLM
jgi:hypothetical protein